MIGLCWAKDMKKIAIRVVCVGASLALVGLTGLYVYDWRRSARLTRALSDPVASVRADAAYALDYSGRRAAVEPLIAALTTDSSSTVWLWAAHSLGRIGDCRAIEPLRSRLGRDDRAVQLYAAASLYQLNDGRDQHILRLIAALTDEDTTVRVSAAILLAWVKDSRALQALTLGRSGGIAAGTGFWPAGDGPLASWQRPKSATVTFALVPSAGNPTNAGRDRQPMAQVPGCTVRRPYPRQAEHPPVPQPRWICPRHAQPDRELHRELGRLLS